MIEPVIRPATQNDLPGLLALYQHLHPDDLAPKSSSAARSWSQLLASELMTVVVADVTGLLVSSCTLVIIPNLTRGARSYGVIENVVTHADYRQKGLGRAVLHTALEKAWEADCYKVMLATGSKREATLQFYEGAGFARGGKTYFEARRNQALIP